jgi:hypothetical protein
MDGEAFEVGVTCDREDETVDVALPGRRREHDKVRRTLRLTPRFSAGERVEVEAAAASVGMTVNGFAAEAVLNVARGTSVAYGASQDREASPRLQRESFAARTAVNRFGNNVNQAVAALHSTGQPPNEASAHAVPLRKRAVCSLDELIGEVHRRLR